jgi:hypothetical protein
MITDEFLENFLIGFLLIFACFAILGGIVLLAKNSLFLVITLILAWPLGWVTRRIIVNT